MKTPISQTPHDILYDDACVAAATAEFYFVRMAYWLREPDKYDEEDMVEMISAWARLGEYLEVLRQKYNKKIPIQILPENEEAEKAEHHYTFDYMEGIHIDIAGGMEASEEFRYDLYSKTIQKYLDKHLAQYKDWLDRGMVDRLDYEEDYELDSMLNERDTLEFFRSGLHIIRATGPVGQIRLNTIDYRGLVRTLRDWDEQFLKPLVTKYKKMGVIHYPLEEEYTPETFWWWKK